MKNVSNLTTGHVLAILGIVAIASTIISLITSPNGLTSEWLSSAFQNLLSEILGAVITFWLFTLILGRRADKERLIREMGSTDNATALNAVRELTAHKWLYDGSLQGAYLINANLKGANLAGANLQGARLCMAELRDTHLSFANLRQADLSNTSLQGVDLISANLQGAVFSFAFVQGASFLRANLDYGEFMDSIFNDRTILPDGSAWTPHTDLNLFTDPKYRRLGPLRPLSD